MDAQGMGQGLDDLSTSLETASEAMSKVRADCERVRALAFENEDYGTGPIAEWYASPVLHALGAFEEGAYFDASWDAVVTALQMASEAVDEVQKQLDEYREVYERDHDQRKPLPVSAHRARVEKATARLARARRRPPPPSSAAAVRPRVPASTRSSSSSISITTTTTTSSVTGADAATHPAMHITDVRRLRDRAKRLRTASSSPAAVRDERVRARIINELAAVEGLIAAKERQQQHDARR